jgi:hypothetical protein
MARRQLVFPADLHNAMKLHGTPLSFSTMSSAGLAEWNVCFVWLLRLFCFWQRQGGRRLRLVMTSDDL